VPLDDPVTITQIDAFTDRPFAGNPAAVVVLDGPADPAWMQSLAAEVNLSETAFVHRFDGDDDGDDRGRWHLRWFTPTTEVALCGHATLATAHHLWTDHGVATARLRFETRSGELTASRLDDGWIELDFPLDVPVPVEPPDGLLEALRLSPDQVAEVAAGKTDLLIELASAQVVRDVSPDFGALRQFAVRGLSVTAPGTAADGAYDFVSRFFGPASGVDEDPVTGSAHCTLGPYWGERLGRTRMLAFQASPRGGVVRVSLPEAGGFPEPGRVLLAGQAVHALQRA
jgi:PhzF family phenazine biosynthesis protein